MKEEVIIAQGDRPFWHNILAAFLYTVTLALILLFFYGFEVSLDRYKVENELGLIQFAALTLAGAVHYSVIQTYYFNLKEKIYKRERSIAMFRLGKWKDLPELEYISVFKKEEDFFEVNLWYVGNKHFKLYQVYEEEDALTIGKKVAATLKIDLLDATVPNDSKWIEI